MKKFLKISRPRFWIYTAGPFWMCTALFIQSDINIIPLLVFLIYFTFPANIFIYGINDLYDKATDSINIKKQSYEQSLDKSDNSNLVWIILLSNIPFWIYGVLVLPNVSLIFLFLFILLSWQYSAFPLRAKAIPFIDSFVSGLLYIVPVGVSWGILVSDFPPFLALLSAFIWSYSMHLYSAVPDIQADRKANIHTGATLMGKNTTLIVCGLLYLVSSIIAYFYIGIISLILVIGYIYLIYISIQKKTESDVLSVYKLFPYFNTFVGIVLFIVLLVN